MHLKSAAFDLAQVVNQALGRRDVEWVFGSPMAGIPIATMVAPLVGANYVGFSEKKGDKLICRFDVRAGTTVLRVEEMTTSGGTPQRVADAILSKNPGVKILDVVGAFLIRCDKNPPGLHAGKLAPVIDLPELGIFFNEWEPESCPLCEEDSLPIENCKRVWQDLLKTMKSPEHPIPNG